MMEGQKATTIFNIFKWKRHRESSLKRGLLGDVSPENEIELSEYNRLSRSGSESPTELLSGDGFKEGPIADLDLFFERLYSYYCEKGLLCIIIKWIVELLSLGFVICFSGFFLLYVDWNGLRNAKCGISAVEAWSKPCDLAKEALHLHPLTPLTTSKFIIIGYLLLFSIYWVFCFLRFFVQLRDTLEIRRFYHESLSITDREVQTIPWASVLEKVVQVQSSQQLCVVKDLSAHDMVMRIMRKENYLIAMLNKGVLAFPVPQWVPGTGPVVNTRTSGKKNHLMLNKSLQWTLDWCILQSMFDRNFFVKGSFVSNPSSLKMRLVSVGVVMLLLSPFIGIFTVVFLFLRHAEQFYNHPSTASSRRWSNLSKWMFREFNEVDHLFRHRINSSVPQASEYLKQFPSPVVTVVAKFISFVSGGFAAILIIIAFLEESLLEGQIFGRNLLWYAAVFGTVTAISRGIVPDELQVLDPEGAMSFVVQHTHYMPKRWRCKENSDMVRTEFEALFQYTGMMLLEEMASIFLTPYLLLTVVPKRVDDILQFILDYTVEVEGVGHVCSLSVFAFERHGNRKYGSPHNAPRSQRSSQGKMEKSFLSFQSSYSSWEPNALGKEFVSNLRNFREQKLQLRTTPTYQHPMTHQLASNSRDRGYIPPQYGYMRSSPVTGYRLGSMWLIDPDQNNHPYLLDWYYTSWSSTTANKSVEVSASPAEGTGLVDDYLIDMTTERGQRFEENWDSLSEERLQSHYEASISNSNLRENMFRQHNTGNVVHPSESRWWMRTGQNNRAPQTSFISPAFGHHNQAVTHDNSAGTGQNHRDPQTSFIEPPVFRHHNNAVMHGNSVDLGQPNESRLWGQSGPYSRAPQTSFMEPPSFRQPVGSVLDDNSGSFGHPTESHWWGRTRPNSGAVEMSFLEPPTFAHNTRELVQDNSGEITEEQEQFLDWRNFGRPQSLFYNDDNDENAEVDLPFTDSNGEYSLPFDDIYQTPLTIPIQKPQ